MPDLSVASDRISRDQIATAADRQYLAAVELLSNTSAIAHNDG
jgi:carboxyl-terminal processing protease